MGYRATSAFTRGSGFGGFMGPQPRPRLRHRPRHPGGRPGLGGPYFDERRPQNPDFTKVSWGLSTGDGKVVALGVGLHWMLDRRSALRRPDLDFGLLIRLRNHASLGATVRLGPTDLTPQGALLPELAATGELAIRPLGTRTLELAGGLRARWRGSEIGRCGTEDFLGLLPRGRVAFRHQGIEIAGEVEQVRANLLDRDTFQRVGDARALRGSVALALAGTSSACAPACTPASATASTATASPPTSAPRAGPVFWPRIVEAERIDVSTVRDERSLIRMLDRLDAPSRPARARSS
jgi:protease-4